MEVELREILTRKGLELRDRADARVVAALPQRQIGRGVPQKRSRESAQSTLFSSQSPKRPCLMCSGCQPICSFSRSSASRWSDVRANHVGFAQ